MEFTSFSRCALPLARPPNPSPLLVYRLLDRTDGKLKRPVPHLTSISPHLSEFYVDELLVLQLANVFGHRVGAHAGMLTDLPDAGPA